MAFFSDVSTVHAVSPAWHVMHAQQVRSLMIFCIELACWSARPILFPVCMQIALVLIDEVHLLNESRGAALEAGCISRIRMVSQLPEMKQVSKPSMHAGKHPAVTPSLHSQVHFVHAAISHETCLALLKHVCIIDGCIECLHAVPDRKGALCGGVSHHSQCAGHRRVAGCGPCPRAACVR